MPVQFLNRTLFCLFFLTMACQNNPSEKVNEVKHFQEDNEVPANLVIAHRGTTYWAPEETEAAMRWARNIGADYLEFDIQRTRDGVLIALHDDNLQRTTDINEKFPDRKDEPVSTFTYSELLSLDAGSWFNIASPERAKPGFKGLEILTLEDILQIAEGKRIKRNENGKPLISEKNGKIVKQYETDPADNGNRPGVYVETKVPELFPGIEKDLKEQLILLGWHNDHKDRLKAIKVKKGRVSIGGSEKRLILQTFSKASLKNLNNLFENYVPLCFLLWLGEGKDDLPDNRHETFKKWVKYGKINGASIIGPSIGGGPNDYPDLLTKENATIIHDQDLDVHAYTFDTKEQMEKYVGQLPKRADGMFTNRADIAIEFYKKYYRREIGCEKTADAILQELGYGQL